MRWNGLEVLLLFAMAVLPSMSRAASDSTSQAVVLHYIQRPPYMMVVKDGLAGLTGAPSYRAFRRAGIPFEIRETPFARQLRIVEANSGQDCMIGMFRKPERELFARFTRPVYRDQTQVILTAMQNAQRVGLHNTIEELFGDQELVFLAKLGYSYGAALDARIDALRPVIKRTTDENLMMLKAIKMNMADYMVVAPEEASEAISAAGFGENDFKQIRIRNMPVGEYRHIMCSKNVSEETIRKLNLAIVDEK